MHTLTVEQERTEAPSAAVWFARIALALTGVGILAWALSSPVVRNPYGFPDVTAHVFVVGGIGLLLLGSAVGTVWERAAAFLALALIGQACALQLIFAPPYDVYQHFLSWREVIGPARLPFLLGLLAQTALTLHLGARLSRSVRAGAYRLLNRRQALAVLAVLIFSAAVLTASPARFGWEVIMAGWVAGVAIVNLILVVAAIPDRTLERIAGKLAAVVSGRDAAGRLQGVAGRFLPWAVAGWTTLIAAWLAWYVFEAVPHIPDDVSYLFQAKYFASGHLYLPAPPDAASFTVGQVANDGGRWFGYGFPGWPAVLAIGVLAGAPWLVNPILAGAIVLLLHTLIVRLNGRAMAAGVVTLLAVSPWFLFMSASFMTHTVTLFWSALALLAIENERDSGKGYWGLLAGAALAALFLTRPLEGLVVGAACAAWALGLGRRRLSVRGLTGAAIAAVTLGALVFPYNRMLTGDALYPAHQKWTDQAWYEGADRLGFGRDIGNVDWPHLDPLPGHGALDVAINANRNLYMSNVELFGWSFGSIALALLALAVWRVKREDWVFLVIAAGTVAAHALYWFGGGPDLGARYWYQAVIPLVILTVRGIQLLQDRVGRPRALMLVVLACLVAFPNFMTWRSFGKYHRYRGMSADVRQLAARQQFGRSLVFVRAQDRVDYAAAFILNPPNLNADAPIYAIDLGADHRGAVERAFPDRPVWVIGYETAESIRMNVLARP